MATPRQPGPRWALAAAAACALAVLVMPVAAAQVPPVVDGSSPSSTTTTAQEQAPPPSSGPSGDDLADGADQAPPGAKDPGGDGAPAPAWGLPVPPEAQRIISSVARTGPSSSEHLVGRLAELRELGLPEAEAMRVGLGRFPIAGVARYTHDWLFPRYGPGFRFHLGTDVFAAKGTPVRAPVDGIARSADNSLGGLTVKVIMPDGTYFYLAHLSGLVEGFVDDMPVKTGDVVGYVGNSGNARTTPPHLHIGIYPNGGPPIDPKPVLDQFLLEAEARLPQVVEAYRAALARGPAPASTPTSAAPALGSDASDVVDPLAADGAGLPAEVIYAASANAVRGPRALVDLALDELVADIDWMARAAQR